MKLTMSLAYLFRILTKSYSDSRNAENEGPRWCTMYDKIGKLTKRECWDLIELAGTQWHTWKWVLLSKIEADRPRGLRAHWVVRGDSWVLGFEFVEMFVTAGDLIAARIVFALSAQSASNLLITTSIQHYSTVRWMRSTLCCRVPKRIWSANVQVSLLPAQEGLVWTEAGSSCVEPTSRWENERIAASHMCFFRNVYR